MMKSKPHRPSRNAATMAQIPFTSSWQWVAGYPTLIWQSMSSHRLFLPVMPLPGWNFIPPFLNKSASRFETQFLWEAFVHKCLWHSVSCSQCLLVCLLQPRAWRRVCIMSLWASNVHCSHQMLHTYSFLLINQIQETETLLNWKTLEIEDSFTL